MTYSRQGPAVEVDGADLAIEASGLVKTFGTTRAVDHVDLAVWPGSVFAVLGPNGAGKTTTIRMLATLLQPDSGTARVFGNDVVGEPEAVRGRVSLTGQFAAVDEDLTGTEYLVLMARLRGYSRRQARTRAHELLDGFGLSDAANRQVKAYSGGMRRRIDVAASLVATPDLLFLDEPTTGLDPRSRNQVWEIVRAIVADGTTVLLTTQYLDEADHLADRIAVIDHGRVVATGTANQLKAKVGGQTLVVRPQDRADLDLVESLVAELTQHDPVLDAERGELSADVTDAGVLAGVVQRLDAFEIPVTEIGLRPPSLDEVFLALTGQPGTDSPTTGQTITTEDAA